LLFLNETSNYHISNTAKWHRNWTIHPSTAVLDQDLLRIVCFFEDFSKRLVPVPNAANRSREQPTVCADLKAFVKSPSSASIPRSHPPEAELGEHLVGLLALSADALSSCSGCVRSVTG
jgi:hypothetical protein